MSTARIQSDVHCSTCGYNLRAMALDAACPECGAPVRRTMEPNPLVTRNPEWIRRVHQSTFMVIMLLPWFWLPLSWPLLAWGLWGMLTPAPQERGLRRWDAFAQRGLALVLLFVTCSTLLLACVPSFVSNWFLNYLWSTSESVLAIIGLSAACGLPLLCAAVVRLTRTRELRALWRHALIALILAALAAIALLVSFFVPKFTWLDGNEQETIWMAGAIGVLTILPAIVLLIIALLGLWRRLAVADAYADIADRFVRAWPRDGATQGPPPAAPTTGGG